MKGAVSSPVSAALQDGFGCAVANRFQQLLDDESDPLDILRQAEEERSRRKRKEEAKKPGAAAGARQPPPPPKKETQKDRRLPSNLPPPAPFLPVGQKQAPKRGDWDGQNENWGTELKVERTERRTAFKEFRPNENDGPVEFASERPFDRWDRERSMRGRGGMRGGMRGRGRGGGFVKTWDGGLDQRGKREFERHSGSDKTGIRAEDKKGGSGAHNWGTVKDDLSDMEQTTPMEETPDEHHEATEGDPEAKVVDETLEVAAPEMTLDEWKSLQEQVRPKQEFNIRKPDSTVPSKAVVIHKSKFKDDGLKEDEDDEHQYFRRPANDITSQLDINFGSLSRPGRGGRGGARGGSRGRIKKPEGLIPEVVPIEVPAPSMAPNPDDPEDFPALA